MGAGDVGGDRDRVAVEGHDRRRLSRGGGDSVSGIDAAVTGSEDMGALAAGPRNPAFAPDRGALACSGYAAKSAIPGFHDAQRTRLVSWLLLVLFHQRADTAVSELAVSQGLQYRAAVAILGVPFAMAVSVERVLAGGFQVGLPEAGSGIAHAVDGAMLVRFYSGIFYALDDARVLLDAMLSGARAVAGFGDG